MIVLVPVVPVGAVVPLTMQNATGSSTPLTIKMAEIAMKMTAMHAQIKSQPMFLRNGHQMGVAGVAGVTGVAGATGATGATGVAGVSVSMFAKTPGQGEK